MPLRPFPFLPLGRYSKYYSQGFLLLVSLVMGMRGGSIGRGCRCGAGTLQIFRCIVRVTRQDGRLVWSGLFCRLTRITYSLLTHYLHITYLRSNDGGKGIYVVMCLCNHRALECVHTSHLKGPNRRTSARTWSQWDIDAGGCTVLKIDLLCPRELLLPGCYLHVRITHLSATHYCYYSTSSEVGIGLRLACAARVRGHVGSPVVGRS